MEKIWDAYRPGEDAKFPNAWVSRDRGVLCTCVNSKQQLTENAKLNSVVLKWKPKTRHEQVQSGGVPEIN